MIEKHRYHGSVNSQIERPDPSLIVRLAQHDAAKVGDAMARHGIMDSRIKPVAEGSRLTGPAVTVSTRPGDALYVAHSSDIAQPGDVIVVDAGGIAELAVFGERLASYMMERGILGLVVDGAVRDVRGIRELGFATFAAGVTPRLLGSSGPGAINIPISCGGVYVDPGDVIVADDDGVVVVPRSDAERVADLADEHLRGELDRQSQVTNGSSITDVQNLRPRLERWA